MSTVVGCFILANRGEGNIEWASRTVTPKGSSRLSLVVPTYGVEQYLPAFLESLSSQDVPLRDLQLIFVDDGSPDRSAQVIGDWADRHAPHTIVLSKENGGASSARNAALELIERGVGEPPGS